MKILITGSKGVIGVPLLKALRERGHEVWGTDLDHDCDSQYVRADVREYRQVDRVLSLGFDMVIHLAAEFGRINGEEYFENLWMTNVIGTRNILELQRIYRFSLIFASSSEIYGEQVDAHLKEDLPMAFPVLQLNDYAITKWVNELQCMNFEKRYGSRIMRLRFFNVYGPGEYYTPYRSVVSLFVYRALFNLPYRVYRNYYRPFMYVDDFIHTMINAVESFREREVVNVGGTEVRSVEELSEIVLKETGGDPSLVEMVKEEDHNVRSKFPDLSKAKRWFDHSPKVRLEEGVRRTVVWMRQVYDKNGRLR